MMSREIEEVLRKVGAISDTSPGRREGSAAYLEQSAQKTRRFMERRGLIPRSDELGGKWRTTIETAWAEARSGKRVGLLVSEDRLARACRMLRSLAATDGDVTSGESDIAGARYNFSSGGRIELSPPHPAGTALVTIPR